MRFQKPIFRPCRSLIMCALAMALLGCSKSNEAAPRNSQVVARIGEQAISIQELETELRATNIPADRRRDDAVVKKALGDVVARKYLVQQAMNAKLDREPTVLLDILRSREQVLVDAFATREVSRKASAISIDESEKYIRERPFKFAGRKIIAIDQISFPLAAATPAFIASAGELTSIEQVNQKLTELGISHSRSSGSLSTSDIPDALSNALQGRKQGDVVFIRSGPNGVFVKINGEELRPLQGEAALVIARQQQQNEIAKADASLANFTASTEAKYEGEYAKIMRDPKLIN